MKKKSNRHQPVRRGSLSDLFEEHAPNLQAFLMRRVGNRIDAQDIAQEAYLRLLRVEKIELIRAPQAYLFRIADNLSKEFLIRRKRRFSTVSLDDVNEANLRSRAPTPEAQAETLSQLKNLKQILHELPPLYQAILIMRKRDGYSHAEIAQKLNISRHTVHKYLKRALTHCREKWVED